MNGKKEILQRVSDLESEVRLLRRELDQLKDLEHPIEASVHEKKRYVPASSVRVEQPLIDTSWPQKEKKEVDFEKQFRVWLPRVFMFILLLGVLWGLKVGMEYGVITGVVRIALGFVGSAGLYFLGMRYIRLEKNGFGLTLLGGFIALGILTTFAAHYLYGYFNFFVAFVVGIAYIAAGLYLSLRTKSETLTIFSAIAGFLLPFLLEGQGTTELQFCLYLVVLFSSLFFVSLRHAHKYSFYATFLLFHLTLVIYVLLAGFEVNENIIVATALLQHLLLLVVYVKGYIKRHVFTETLIYTNVVFALAWIKLLVYGQEILFYALFALLYVALAVIAFAKRTSTLRGVLVAVAIFTISAFILAFQTDEMYGKVILLLLNGAIGVWIGLYYRTVRPIVTGGFVYLLSAYTTITAVDFTTVWSIEHIVWIVLFVSMAALYSSFYRWRPAFIKERIRLDQSLVIGQLIVLIYIFKIVNLWLTDTNLSYQTVTHVELGILLLVLRAFYLLRNWRYGRFITHAVVIEFLLASVVVLGTSLGSNEVDNLFYVNIGVQLAYVAWLLWLLKTIVLNQFYILLKVKTTTLAVCMQISTFIFLNKWYFAIVWQENWSTEWILLGHTFWLLGFAFLSISVGRKMQWKAVTMLGIVLIGVCVIKLFLVDLYSISIVIRSILFIVVGVAGLLYSRTLWKE